MPTSPNPTPAITPATPFIHDESLWRQPAALDRLATGQSRAVVSRWRAAGGGVREVTAESGDFHHTIGIALRPMDVAFLVDGRPVHDGRLLPGMLQASGPGEKLRAVFRGAYDVLHLHLSSGIVAECLEQAEGYPHAGEISLADRHFSRDPVIERLAQSLLMAEDSGAVFGELYAESVGIAVVTRLLGLRANAGLRPTRRQVAALPKWRVKRAADYIDAHLGGPITLAELAEATGLTRMHFASQFRIATGFRPHEYLLRKRIERACDLLGASDASLVEIALSVGFQTQAHFTTVFKRFMGETPHRWRAIQRTRMAGGSEPRIVGADYQLAARPPCESTIPL
jgi:AraC family transcriptional regulator